VTDTVAAAVPVVENVPPLAIVAAFQVPVLVTEPALLRMLPVQSPVALLLIVPVAWLTTSAL